MSNEDQDQESNSDRVLIIHGASHSADFGPYAQELSRVANTTGWITYVPTVSRPWDEPGWHGETGRIEDIVRKHADASGFLASNSFAYTCGHPNMITNVKEILKRAGFLADQVQLEEYFGPAKIDRPIRARRVDGICNPTLEVKATSQPQAKSKTR